MFFVLFGNFWKSFESLFCILGHDPKNQLLDNLKSELLSKKTDFGQPTGNKLPSLIVKDMFRLDLSSFYMVSILYSTNDAKDANRICLKTKVDDRREVYDIDVLIQSTAFQWRFSDRFLSEDTSGVSVNV